MDLRDYQERAIAQLRQELINGKKRPVVQAPTGAGKTVIAAAIVEMARAKNKTIIFTVPALSLIDQTVERFKQNGIYDVGVMQGRHELTDYRMPVQVCSVQTLARRTIPRADLVIVDECFSAGTMVSTCEGEKPIESLNVGDRILCATGEGQIMSISCKMAKTITVRFSNGRTIKVTREHPFFTERGWVNAETLGVGSHVYGTKDMFALWGGDDSQNFPERITPIGKELERKSVLRNILLKETRQPNEQECGSLENEGHFTAHQACTYFKGWERNAIATATVGTASRFGGGVASGSGDTDKNAPWVRLPDELQVGHCKFRREVGIGGRRPLPQWAKESFGQEKGSIFGSIRVESITFNERASDEPVYNLHVSGHPSYFAEGVLVHNCHVMFKLYDDWMADPEWTNVPFVGLTATPWSKGMGKKGRWDGLIIGTTTEELINLGHLSDFKTYAPSHPDLSEVKTMAGDYEVKGLGAAMDKKNLVADIVSTWLEKGQNRPTICFAVNRLHAKNIQNSFIAAGVAAEYMDAFTDLAERADIVRRFANGEAKVICNVGVLTTGFDADVRCIILARPTKSQILFTQMIGRGLRTAAGKRYCLILDHSDTTLRLGFVTDIKHDKLDDGTARRNLNEKPARVPKECPKCSFLKPVKVRVCPACGFTPEPKSQVEVDDGELYELTRDKKLKTTEASLDQKQQFYSELVLHAHLRGYKQGWASHAYRDKYKVWPAHQLHDRPARFISPATDSWIVSRNIRKAKAKSKINQIGSVA